MPGFRAIWLMDSAPARPSFNSTRTLGHWLYVALIALVGVAIFWQAIFAGQFLSGHGSALSFHENGGHVAALSAIALMVVEILVGRRTRQWRIPVLAIVLSVAILVQHSLGYMSASSSRWLAIHVPLGVSIAGVYCFYAALRLLPRR